MTEKKSLARRVVGEAVRNQVVFMRRLRIARKRLFSEVALITRWLVKQREFTNYTYQLSDRNLTHLVGFVAEVTGRPRAEIRDYITEIETNEEFRQEVRARRQVSHRGSEVDEAIAIGRRAGWYATIRALKPKVLVETGTDKGLGTCVIAEALMKNGVGHVYTLDIDPHAGFLVGPRHKEVVTQLTGDSIDQLKTIRDIDWFIHDSDHSMEHEMNEFEVITPNLSANALCLSDNAHVTDVLANWSDAHHRHFLFFQERPQGHWYPGAGIGASWG